MLLKLLGLPFTLPAAGMRFVFNTLIETAEAEMMDDAPVKEALLELQLRLEEGEISEDEYAEQEQVLFERLREIRAYRQQAAAEERAAAIEYSPGGATVETGLEADESER